MVRKGMMAWILFLLVGAGLGLGACSSDQSATAKLVSIKIEPESAKIVVGETRQFTAIGTFEDLSTRDITLEVVWNSSNESVATINAQGVVTGIAENGTTLIMASAGPIASDPSTLEVVSAANRLTAIQVDPVTANIQLGASYSFSATGTYLDGSSRDITTEVMWESSNPTIVSVSNTPGSKGVAIGLAAGSAEITARSSDVLSNAALATVNEVALLSIAVAPLQPTLPVGTTQQFRATGTYSDDSTADLTHVVTWMSSNKVVADFSSEPGEEGRCTALAEGTTSVTAIRGSVISDPVSLTVTSATLQELDIEPAAPTVPVGASVQFSATGTFSDGQVLDLTGSVQWHSGNGAAVIFDPQTDGLALALAEGSAEIWASYNGTESPRVVMTVSSATLESIEISPASPTLPVGQQLQFHAFGHYSDQSVVEITPSVTWASSDPTVATISNAAATRGLATGLSQGSTTVSATLNGTRGEVTLQVRAIEIVSILVTPSQATLPVGENLQCTAMGTFSDSSEAEVTSIVTWHVGSTLVAQIGNSADDRGEVTAMGVGTTTVWCVAPNSVASSPVQLTVTSATLSSIDVTAPDASIVVGATNQFTATGRYTDGSQLDITDDVNWTSSEESVAVISNVASTKGLATALSEGVTFISATKDAVGSNSFRLEVVAPTLESIAVTPATASIAVGESVTYTAMGHYSDNQDRNITQMAYWESSNSGVASVSNAAGSRGVATGNAEGSTNITASYQGVTSPAASLGVTAPVNQQPVAVLSGDTTAAVGATASFSGLGSYDPDGTVVNYTFNFGDGTGDMDNGANPDVTHAFAAANTYTVVLTVTDNLGATGSDTLNIVVTPDPNEAPHAILVCPTSGQVSQSLEFDASNSYDNDGTITNYTFNFGDGSGDFDNGLNPTIFHAFGSEATFTVQLIVTDDDGAQNAQTCQVPIGATTLPDVRIIRPQGTMDVTQGQVVNVLVDANAQGGFSVTKVELLADGVFQGEDTTAPYEFDYTVPLAALTGSTITLQAQAYDNNTPVGVGQSQPAFLEVKNYPPVADFTATISDALEVTVDASSCSDVETPTADLEVRWDWESDGTWDTTWDTTKVLTHTYAADGQYTITMQVRDDVAQIDSTTRTVDLASQQTVGGTITTTTWYGTIIVTGSVTVPAGEVLTVNPNTQILVMYLDQDIDGIGDFGIYIDGEIHVNGTDTEPVLFTVYGSAHKEPGAWQGIVVSGANASSFDTTVVEYANIGLEIQNASTVTNSTFRFNKEMGLYLNNGDNASLTDITTHDNEGEGLVLQGSDNVTMSGITAQNNGTAGLRLTSSNGGTLTTCLVTLNGADGVDLINSDLDIVACSVTYNQGFGFLYRGGSDGSLTQSVVTYNDDVGIRAVSSAQGHPHPAITYNNIFGNSVVGGTADLLADPSGTLDLAGPYSSGTYTSSTWTAPGGGVIRRANVDYDYNYYCTGILRDGGNNQLWSSSSSYAGWVWLDTFGVSDLKVALNQSYSSSSNYSNHITVTQVEYSVQNQPGLEMSVAVTSGSVNARYNYWGVFPNVLDHIAYTRPDGVDIQGFVGVAFDPSWDTGPYKAGALTTETWSGTIFVTGDVSVPSGETLTIESGTQVLFVPTDQDFDGIGDYGIYVDGALDVAGTSADRVSFTALGAAPTTSSYDRVEVDTSGASTIQYADFTYGHVGLEVGDGSSVSHCSFENNNQYGLYLNDADNSTLDNLSVRNNLDTGIRMQNTSGATMTYLDVELNAGMGVSAYSVSSSTISDSTFQDNGGTGMHLLTSTLDIDHCAFLYNGGEGIRYEGNSNGTLSYSNIKYNDLPGLMVLVQSSSNPQPDISYCNLYGNSVSHSIEPNTYDPSATLDLAGPYSSGTYRSSVWALPTNGYILRANVDYDYNYYCTGTLYRGDDTSLWSSSSSYAGWVYVGNNNPTDLKVGLTQSYSSSSNYSNHITVTSVEVLEEAANTIELTAATSSGQVTAHHNYWGQSMDVFERISMLRPTAVDFTSWELSEVTPCGPR